MVVSQSQIVTAKLLIVRNPITNTKEQKENIGKSMIR